MIHSIGQCRKRAAVYTEVHESAHGGPCALVSGVICPVRHSFTGTAARLPLTLLSTTANPSTAAALHHRPSCRCRSPSGVGGWPLASGARCNFGSSRAVAVLDWERLQGVVLAFWTVGGCAGCCGAPKGVRGTGFRGSARVGMIVVGWNRSFEEEVRLMVVVAGANK